MAGIYGYDKRGNSKLLHIDASAANTPYVEGPSGLGGKPTGTNELTWRNQFRRNDSQLTQADLPGAVPTPAAAPVAAPVSAIHSVLGEIFNSPTFAQAGGVPAAGETPTLTQLAQGSSGNHAQTWMEWAQQGMRKVAPFIPPNSNSSTTYGGGLRRPYIGGEKDMTNKFIAGGQFSSYKAGSDSTLDPNRFSFASAFR